MSRGQFEKMCYQNKWNIFRNPKTGEYCDDFVNGAWYAWQEQQKKIDEIKKIISEYHFDSDRDYDIYIDRIEDELK